MATKYTGEAASGYEAQRIGTQKWEFEQRCVEAMLPNCATVLDVPVGTGRFLDLYGARGIEAVGMDISADMLQQAGRKKDWAAMVCGDVFEHDFPDAFDCVVCVRFLNWFAAPDLARLVARLAELTRRHVLVSITTTEGPAKVKSTGTVIPNAADAWALFAANGLSVVEVRSNEQKGGNTAHIVLLEKHAVPA